MSDKYNSLARETLLLMVRIKAARIEELEAEVARLTEKLRRTNTLLDSIDNKRLAAEANSEEWEERAKSFEGSFNAALKDWQAAEAKLRAVGELRRFNVNIPDGPTGGKIISAVSASELEALLKKNAPGPAGGK